VPSEREKQFLTLVHQNDSRLRHICRVYSRDAESFEDLHQEILLQLWRSLPSFNGASSPDTWLYRVALNTALAASRRSRPDRLTAALDDEGLDVEDPAQPDVEDLLDAGERTERLYAAIDRLNEVDKMLITMYLDERSYRDMADVIGIGINHIGVRLHRIKKALVRRLARETV
jgi:RNA polymerase sigma-70 factor, ECF subfamily